MRRSGLRLVVILATVVAVSLMIALLPVSANEGPGSHQPSHLLSGQDPDCGPNGPNNGPGRSVITGTWLFQTCGMDGIPAQDWWKTDGPEEDIEIRVTNADPPYQVLFTGTTVGGEITFTFPVSVTSAWLRVGSFPTGLKDRYTWFRPEWESYQEKQQLTEPINFRLDSPDWCCNC